MKTEKKYKTPEYTRRAINKYNSKFARFTISTPREVKDRLNAVLKAGESANALINDLLLQEIERREADLEQELHEGPEAAPQEATQAAKPGARTNSHEAHKSRTEGRTEGQEAPTSAGAAEGSLQEEPTPRGRSRKASAATTGGPEEGSSQGKQESSTKAAKDLPRIEPVEAADTAQPISPGEDNLQQLLLYPYDMHDDIPPEELPFH